MHPLKIQRLQSFLKQGKTIIQLIRLCENIELDHQKMSDIIGKKRKFLNYSEEDLKAPPTSDGKHDQIADEVNVNLKEILGRFRNFVSKIVTF